MALYALYYHCYSRIQHILAALIVSEQMLLSIEAQLCTRKECKTFRPRRPSSVNAQSACETLSHLYSHQEGQVICMAGILLLQILQVVGQSHNLSLRVIKHILAALIDSEQMFTHFVHCN